MAIRNYVVQFDLPYHIQVEDSFKENQESRYYPIIEEVPAELRFQSNVEDSNNDAVAGTATGDRHGNLGYSSVQVWFDNQFIETIPDDIDDEKPIEVEPIFHMGQPKGTDRYLIKSAVEYLNKFLNVYRSATAFYWISSLASHEITRFSIVNRHEDGSEDNRLRFVTESALKSGPMEEDILNRVKQGVQMKSPVSLYNEIDLNAEDKIDRGEFNSAIIDSATLFETWIKGAFQRIAIEQGYSKEEAKDMITKGNGSGEFLNPKNIASDHISNMGINFSDTEEFNKWDKNTRDVRNKVIHEGYQATSKEARRAKDSTVEALIKISEEFEEELEGTTLFVQEQTSTRSNRPGQDE